VSDEIPEMDDPPVRAASGALPVKSLLSRLRPDRRCVLKLRSNSLIRRRSASFSCFAVSNSERCSAVSSYRALNITDGCVGERALPRLFTC